MGITHIVLESGTSSVIPKAGQRVKVHYTGKLEDGTEFDSSRNRNNGFEFVVGKGQVIKGWDEGITKMQLGEKCKLICTPDYAYGARGYPGVYPFIKYGT